MYYLYVTNKNAQVTNLELTYEAVDESAPQLSADNVDIAYDASNGSIAYTLTNPVTDGVLSASTESGWLTLGTVGKTVPFTCTANSAGTARSATVTLTYTYNTNEIITKDVTVTQAANPNFAMTIAEVRAQGTGSVVTKGVVTSTYGKNAYIQDAEAAIVVRTDGDLTCVVGDEIRVSGTLGDYNGLLQIQNANITKLTSGNTVTPEVMTIANVNNSTNQGWLVKIVDATVTAISDKNVTIEQGEYSIEVRFNNATDITFAVNDILTLTGNIGHYNGSNQIANPTDVVKKEPIAVTLTFTGVPETITKGETTICKVTAEPSVEGITYSSSDENIVQVGSETGKITAMGIGTATITANYAGDSDHSSATASYTIQVIGAPHTATFYVNGDKLSELTVNEGSDIEFPVVEEQEINGKKFVGWTTSEITEPTNTKPTLVTSATMGDDNVNYYAVYANVESEGSQTTVTDELTRETTGVPDQTNENNKTYSTWEGKEGSSGAVYAGQSAGDKNSIQLRSNNNNSGVITTTSGGSVKKVVVAWKDDTTDGRTLNVYGKNSAYSAATDLYGDNAGTLLGTIVKGTSTELTISGDYEYVGLRSASGAMYLTSISITWENSTPASYSDYCTTVVAPVKPAKPIVFHDGGEYEGTLTVAIAGEGTIKYTLNGDEQTYTAPFTINETTVVKAWTEQDGAKSDVVEKTFTIVAKQAGAEVPDGYYTIQTNDDDGKYVNVAGRKTVTLVSDNEGKAGTVIRVKADAEGVKVLRSQGVDVPGYAKKAMNYVPEIVQLAVDKLHAEGSGEILGEHGLDAIMEEFNKSFDYNLYLEKSGDAYRIYGRTPSMKPVVDFYAKNKANVDAKLPQLEAFINSAIDKVLEKTGNRGASILVDFKLHDVWQNMDGTLTEPVDEASTMKFYEEVLSSETNVWNFAYQTAMIYWGNLKDNDTFKKYIGKLGDYAKYIDKVENIRPNFKYYIVPSESGVDFISEGNEAITGNNASAAWAMEPVTTFQIEVPNEKTVTVYPTSGGTQRTYKEYYTTLYTDFAYTLPEGVKAYKVTEITEKYGVAKREEITGTIPAQTPVLLVGESNTATLTLSTEAGTAITGNLLVGPDALINEYQIKTPQVVSLFDFAKEILGESAYKAYVKKYEHLMLKNAGTVNNKYFFGLTEDDLGDVTNLRILGMGYENELGFHDIWEKIDANKAFILTNDYDPVKLFLVGDVNRDGAVSIADVTALVNIILGKAKYPDDNDKYDFEAANVNGDKTISIADVTALVNIILGK